MPQEIGESREKWGLDVCEMVGDYAEKLRKEEKPFYIVYAAKPDKSSPGTFRQTIKAYYQQPPPILGILVWYVDHPKGIFKFRHDLSSPPDIPVPKELLSEKKEDLTPRIAERGRQLNVLLS
jgi:hypothetical protein